MSTSSSSVDQRIRDFVFAKFPIARKRNLKDSDELLESGIVDSLGVLDIVTFLETEFGLTVSDDDLSPDNFGSIQHIIGFAERGCGNGT